MEQVKLPVGIWYSGSEASWFPYSYQNHHKSSGTESTFSRHFLPQIETKINIRMDMYKNKEIQEHLNKSIEKMNKETNIYTKLNEI